MTKVEWRKDEKSLYMPTAHPTLIRVPAFKFFVLEGSGNPNGPDFAACVAALYSLAYAVRMSSRQGLVLDGYFDYSVYPLEGVWDISDALKKRYDGTLDKNELVYRLMIRQPEFLTEDAAMGIIDRVQTKKPQPLLKQVMFEGYEEGACVQMLHLGSYDGEPASFEEMERFAGLEGRRRESKRHREIYLSDARKVAAEKLKTVLRFRVN